MADKLIETIDSFIDPRTSCFWYGSETGYPKFNDDGTVEPIWTEHYNACLRAATKGNNRIFLHYRGEGHSKAPRISTVTSTHRSPPMIHLGVNFQPISSKDTDGGMSLFAINVERENEIPLVDSVSIDSRLSEYGIKIITQAQPKYREGTRFWIEPADLDRMNRIIGVPFDYRLDDPIEGALAVKALFDYIVAK